MAFVQMFMTPEQRFAFTLYISTPEQREAILAYVNAVGQAASAPQVSGPVRTSTSATQTNEHAGAAPTRTRSACGSSRPPVRPSRRATRTPRGTGGSRSSGWPGQRSVFEQTKLEHSRRPEALDPERRAGGGRRSSGRLATNSHHASRLNPAPSPNG